MNNAALVQAVSWPQIPAEPIDTASDFWRRESLARYLAHADEETYASWQEMHARPPSFVLDIAKRMQREFDACAQARALLSSVHHSEIRAWLQTLPHPHQSVWAERFTREKKAIKEASNVHC